MNDTAATDLTVTRLTATNGSAPGVAASSARTGSATPKADSGSGGSFSQALDDAAKPVKNQTSDDTQPPAAAVAPAAPAVPQSPAAARPGGAVQRPEATAAELLLANLNSLEAAAPAAGEHTPAAAGAAPGGDALPKDGTKLPPDPDPRAVLLALGQPIPTAAPAQATPAPATDAAVPADGAAYINPGSGPCNGDGGARTASSPTPMAPTPSALAAALAGGTGGASAAIVSNAAADGATPDDDTNPTAGLSPGATTAAATRDFTPTEGLSRLLSAAGIFLQGVNGAGATGAATASPAPADAGSLAIAAAPLPQSGGMLATTDTPASTASATASPAPLQPLANPATWAQALGDRVLVLADQGMQQATLHLQPEHLGPLQIHIQMDDGNAQVSFSAHHPDTRAALSEALPRLREMFNEQGLTLLQANVDAGSGRAGHAPDPNRPWGPGTVTSAGAEDDRVTTTARTTLWQLRPAGSRRIDLLV